MKSVSLTTLRPWFAGLLIGLVCGGFALESAQAELPPGSYNSLRVSAAEAVILEATKVTTKAAGTGKTEVTIEAKVLTVERSKNGLKPGATIAIHYTSIDQAKLPGFVGPRPVPVLVQGAIYPAFLTKSEDGKAYEPAAYGESFVMTPEG